MILFLPAWTQKALKMENALYVLINIIDLIVNILLIQMNTLQNCNDSISPWTRRNKGGHFFHSFLNLKNKIFIIIASLYFHEILFHGHKSSHNMAILWPYGEWKECYLKKKIILPCHSTICTTENKCYLKIIYMWIFQYFELINLIFILYVSCVITYSQIVCEI